MSDDRNRHGAVPVGDRLVLFRSRFCLTISAL
jgi:hypothetical protein